MLHRMFVLLCVVRCAYSTQSEPVEENRRPLVGILSQPLALEKNMSYIASSYVQWIDGAGAQAIPIMYTHDDEEIVRRFNMVGGIIFPGGSVGLDARASARYRYVAKMLFDLAVNENRAGGHVALYGTCMGFQMLLQFSSVNATSDPATLLTPGFDAKDHPTSLDFTPEADTSFVLGGNDTGMVELRTAMAALEPQAAVYENHEEGVTSQTYQSDPGMQGTFKILSYSNDRQGRGYLSTIEGQDGLPFIGTQWHPEKPPYEWISDRIPHHMYAVKVSHLIAQRFVHQVRLSNHRATLEEESALVIWNTAPAYHSPLVRDFSLIFIFESTKVPSPLAQHSPSASEGSLRSHKDHASATKGPRHMRGVATASN